MYHFEKKEPYGAELLFFNQFSEDKKIIHCFTTRNGGVSEGACCSLNMSFNREPSRDNVLENLKRAADGIGVPFESLTMVPQIHSNKVKIIKEADKGRGVTCESFSEGYDAMVTNVPGITLCTIHGDCIPVYLYDEKHSAVGMIHSGWRGTWGKIAAKTVETMKCEYNTESHELQAVIGPGICGNCFEVSEDVFNAFSEIYGKVFTENETVCRPVPGKENKWLVSLPEIVYITLVEAGLREDNITKSNICTCCEENKNIFFSHRREKGKTGAMTGMIGIPMNIM